MSAWSEHQGARPLGVLLLTCVALPLILAGVCARSAAVGAAEEKDAMSLWTNYTAGDNVADIEPETFGDGYLLWVATSGGVQVWQDSEGFWGITRTLTTIDGLPSNNVRDIAMDQQANKWIATDGGVALILEGTWQVARQWTAADGLANDDVYAVLVDGQGNRWFGTDGGIGLWPAGTELITGTGRITSTCEGLHNCKVRDILADAGGYTWVATWGGGVSVIAPGRGLPTRTFVISNGLASNYVNALLQDPENVSKKWIGTSGGITILDDGGDPIETTNVGSSLYLQNCIRNDAVLSLAAHNSKPRVKWVGIAGHGIVRIESLVTCSGFQRASNHLSGNSVSAIALAPDNVQLAWFGLQGGGVERYEEGAAVGNTRTPAPTRWALTPTPSGLRADDVRKVVVDPDGRKWFGTWGGGFRVLDETRGRWRGQALPLGFVSDIVFEGSDVWMSLMQGTYVDPEDAGIYAASADEALKAAPEWLAYTVPVTVSAAVPFHAVQVIAIDPEGNKWFGTNSHGIAVLPGSGVITEWEIYALPSPTPTSSPTLSPTGRPRTPTPTRTPTATATGTLPTPTVTETPTPWIKSNWIRDIAVITGTTILTDTDGVTRTESYTEYWIATLGGGVNVTTTLKVDGKSRGWASYGAADGLLSNDVWCVAVDALGQRWLGTNGGISVMRETGDGFQVLNNQELLQVRDISFDSSGRAWCATEGGGVYLLRLVGDDFADPIRYTVADGLASNIVWDVEIENGEALTTEVKWFGTAHGASRFAGATALPTWTPTATRAATQTPTATRTSVPDTPSPTVSGTPWSSLVLPLILRST